LTQMHAVAAFALDNRWSLGVGVRRLSGTLSETYSTDLATGRGAGGRGGTYLVVAERSATAKVAAWAADTSVSFRTAAWGLGAMFSTGADLFADADIQVTRLNAGPAEAAARVAASTSYLVQEGARGLGFDVAPELRVAGWMTPASGLRVELDVVRTFWSATDWYRPQESAQCGAGCRTNLPREWRDTLAIRLAAEHDLTERFQVTAGVAKEPSPLPSSLEPRAPPGDARVYAVGGSVNFHRLSFDLGYSFHGGSSPIRHVVALSARARF
jgi:long-subunit fatty acid transport protein